MSKKLDPRIQRSVTNSTQVLSLSPFRSLIKISDWPSSTWEPLMERAQSFRQKSLSEVAFQGDFDQKRLGRFTVATMFIEDSTRTKNSFIQATLNLGLRHLSFDPQVSGLKKGESLEDTLLTLQSMGVHMCIQRTPVSGELCRIRENKQLHLNMLLVNAGDGMHQHPSQALLDLCTLQEWANQEGTALKGKTLMVLGDAMHSRVCHSMIELLPLFGVHIVFVGPPGMLPTELSQKQFLASLPATHRSYISFEQNLDQGIKNADVLYLLRVQKERHKVFGQSGLFDETSQFYGVSLSGKQLLLGKKPLKLPIFHPGPANIGEEIDLGAIRSAQYWGHRQVANGLYTRMAILEKMIQEHLKNS